MRRRGGGSGGRFQQVDFRSEHEPLAAHVLDLHRNELAGGDELLAQSRSFLDVPAVSDRALAGPRPPKMFTPPAHTRRP